MIRGAVWLVVLGVGLYIAYRYVTPQIRAWRYRDAMNQTARLARANGDAEMRAFLLETARELGIPLEPGRLRIHRGPRDGVAITASWEEVVILDARGLGKWVDTLHYAFEATSIESGR